MSNTVDDLRVGKCRQINELQFSKGSALISFSNDNNAALK